VAAIAGDSALTTEEEAVLAAVQAKVGNKGKQVQRKKKLIWHCYLHHKFGKDARRFDNPKSCMWSGN
jgi:hypothetical protein